MEKETKTFVKKCSFFVGVLYIIDLVTTLILVGYYDFVEINPLAFLLITNLGLFWFTIMVLFLMIPLVTFFYCIFFPYLANKIISSEYNKREWIIKIFCGIGTGIITLQQLPNIATQMAYIAAVM
jgi:hypothetical protein